MFPNSAEDETQRPFLVSSICLCLSGRFVVCWFGSLLFYAEVFFVRELFSLLFVASFLGGGGEEGSVFYNV